MLFSDRLAQAVKASVPCCVGLDLHMKMLPAVVRQHPLGLIPSVHDWAKGVINALVEANIPVVKPQSAFFEALGWEGVRMLEDVIQYARQRGIIVLLDGKRNDIGSTAEGYIEAAFGAAKADAVTLSPYLGPESLDPWANHIAENPDKGAFVLLRTSNRGAIAWQGGPTSWNSKFPGSTASQIADWIRDANRGNDLGPFGAVVGATIDAVEMAAWRQALPNTWFLLPGYGAQGATAASCTPAFRADGLGAIVVSAREVLFPPKGIEETDWRAGLIQRAKAFAEDVRTLQ